MRFQERLYQAAVFVGVDGQKHHVTGVLESRFRLFVERVLRAARDAPGGPKIQHDHFAEQRRKLQLFAVRAGEREIASDL